MVPTQTEALLIDGETWELLPMEQTVGEPVAGMKPFLRDVYQPAERMTAPGKGGGQADVHIIDASPAN